LLEITVDSYFKRKNINYKNSSRITMYSDSDHERENTKFYKLLKFAEQKDYSNYSNDECCEGGISVIFIECKNRNRDER